MRTSAGLLLVTVIACSGKVTELPLARPSCASGAPGAGMNCGVDGKTDCCASAAIPGGSFGRLNQSKWPATLSPFRLDVFEVTVGRYRAFAEAYPSSRPKVGDGAHPRIVGSGWKAEWTELLPKTREELVGFLKCKAGDTTCKDEFTTWTDTPGAKEKMPASRVSWLEAFAFCAWDGGRLPTDAEWNYVAVGGDEQRKYPWGSLPADPSRAVLKFTPTGSQTEVGSAPAGVARWGVLDLAGSRIEFVRDTTGADRPDGPLPLPCIDCIRSDGEKLFLTRDASWSVPGANANVGEWYPASGGARERIADFGIRCARD